jgi:hypothetical protein
VTLEPDSPRTLRIAGTALIVMGVVGLLSSLAEIAANNHDALKGVVSALILGGGIWMRGKA